MKINIGLADQERKEIADGLIRVLADTYAVYLKAQYFHWNVTGVSFQSMHLLFESIYTSLAEAVDAIAEHIRILGHRAPGSFSEFAKITTVKEETDVPPAKDMVAQLLDDQEAIVRYCRDLIGKAEAVNDAATVDLLTKRLESHEKSIWMLRSTLE